MNKSILLIVVLLLCINIASAMDIVSGEINTITTVEPCDGTLMIKLTSESGIKTDEVMIDKCSTTDNRLWSCKCQDRFEVKMKPKESTLNIYDMTIQYYIQYDKSYEGTNLSEDTLLLKEQNQRTKKVIDIFTQEPKTIKSYFRIDMQMKNVIMSIIGLVLLLTIVAFKWTKNKLLDGEYAEKDSLNYAVTEEEFNKLFNK